MDILERMKAGKLILDTDPEYPLLYEMNGNEKYYNLPDNLPTDSYRPGTIQEGDLMLYGSNCLVLFYETFATPYNYTRIGKVDNTAGLTEAVGSGNVNVIVEIQN